MISPSLLVANVSVSNFTNLVLFVCHLFIDGQFRHAQVLYDTQVFDDRFLNAFDSVCPVQIPIQTMDITQSSSQLSQSNDRTDHILQLIFFNPKTLIEQIHQFENLFTFYRIFVFCLITDEVEAKWQFPVIDTQNSILSSSPLIVHFNSENGSLHVYWVLENGETIDSSKQCNNDDSRLMSANRMHLFDSMFENYEHKRVFGIKVNTLFRTTDDYTNIASSLPYLGHIFFTNYFYTTMNASFINFRCKNMYNAAAPQLDQVLRHKLKRNYNELSLEYESKEVGNIDHSTILHFSPTLLPPEDEHEHQIYQLYPYQSDKIAVIFVYGADFRRQLDLWIVPSSVQILTIVILIFVVFITIILFMIRQKLNLRRNSGISALMDIIIGLIAGGNLRASHNIERLLFAIVLIGAFFMISIFMGNLLDCIYNIWNQKIDTFDMLANIDIDAPIYINPTLQMHAMNIHQVLKWKIALNVNYKGPELIARLAPHHDNAFIYLVEASRIENYAPLIAKLQRDFDVFQENLCSVGSSFYLESDHYVSDRLIKNINKATSSMIESGLHSFYMSLNSFKQQFIERAYFSQTDDAFQALTTQQLKRPMILVFYLWATAVIVFIAEALVSKWNQWRNQNTRG